MYVCLYTYTTNINYAIALKFQVYHVIYYFRICDICFLCGIWFLHNTEHQQYFVNGARKTIIVQKINNYNSTNKKQLEF